MTTSAATSPGIPVPAERVASIDIIRGAIMVLMALDHVRVYSGLPAGGPTPGIFFTRWVTHFCAPGFVFLAGTSAFLYGRRHPDLARFLVTRGAWLVFLELTFLRWAWTFNFDIAHQMAGVIWVIGWCMILLAVLIRLSAGAVGIVGVVIIAGHNLLDPLLPTLAERPLGWLWTILYVGPFAGPIAFSPEGPRLVVLYSIIPWIGVMAAGYGFGTVMVADPARRRRVCLQIGVGSIALFLVLRGFNAYGDLQPWTGGFLSFLNTTKYPASLDFLLMTLGPVIALVPLLEHTRCRVARWLTVFGRVPFFFYLLHIPLIHALALVVTKIRLGTVSPWLFTNHPMGSPPAPGGYAWSLALLYVVWAVSLVLLYFACDWFAGFKMRRADWWLRYL